MIQPLVPPSEAPEADSPLPPFPALNSYEQMVERLERLADQMVQAMPEKVEAASLQELARVLPVVLSTLKEARLQRDARTDVEQKFIRLMAAFSEPPNSDGGDQLSERP